MGITGAVLTFIEGLEGPLVMPEDKIKYMISMIKYKNQRITTMNNELNWLLSVRN